MALIHELEYRLDQERRAHRATLERLEAARRRLATCPVCVHA
jgi:hypothetical protein